MTQLTWNRGLGYPGPFNDSDFTTAFSGPASGQWTWNRGLGFPGPWNDSSFVTDPGTPGGDYQEGTLSIDAGIAAVVLPIESWAVESLTYAPLGAEAMTSALSQIARNVDSFRIEPRTLSFRIEFK